ncbi:MAG TPA: hypothetical protein VFF60_07855 [Candidatus Binatus sp.]|nr:hypothetical protein [Candidatus Binatus sp.]
MDHDPLDSDGFLSGFAGAGGAAALDPLTGFSLFDVSAAGADVVSLLPAAASPDSFFTLPLA